VQHAFAKGFAGDGPGVDADASDKFSLLHDGNALAQLGGRNCRPLPGGARPKDEQVKYFHRSFPSFHSVGPFYSLHSAVVGGCLLCASLERHDKLGARRASHLDSTTIRLNQMSIVQAYTGYTDWTRAGGELLYAITDRRLYADNKADALARLVDLAAVWATNGVSYIQLREKDLSARELVELTRAVIRVVQKPRTSKILVNGRVDVALAAGADGVHLPSGPDALTPEEVRRIFAAGIAKPPIISVSCHTIEEVNVARQQSPDCILFAPVFEKVIRERAIASDVAESGRGESRLPGSGLELLENACRAATPVPVFALGGATSENAADCLRAGAAGIAAIRLMQQPLLAWKHLV
jgi:thiamine-phosphate pyrophosphorylase